MSLNTCILIKGRCQFKSVKWQIHQGPFLPLCFQFLVLCSLLPLFLWLPPPLPFKNFFCFSLLLSSSLYSFPAFLASYFLSFCFSSFFSKSYLHFSLHFSFYTPATGIGLKGDNPVNITGSPSPKEMYCLEKVGLSIIKWWETEGNK